MQNLYLASEKKENIKVKEKLNCNFSIVYISPKEKGQTPLFQTFESSSINPTSTSPKNAILNSKLKARIFSSSSSATKTEIKILDSKSKLYYTQ